MRFFDKWSSKHRVPGPEEVSPGGSDILRYDKPELRIGQQEDNHAPEREAVYKKMFGPIETVSHEVLTLSPHIDVYIHPPTERRGFTTLVTGGMSDRRMNAPPQVRWEARRTEILLYVSEVKEEYLGLLRYFAHFPFDLDTWLGHGHTIPNGQPAAPLFDHSELDSALLIHTIVRPDNTLPQELVIDGDPVSFLWLVPLTMAECDLKLREGISAVLDLFDRMKHPILLDERRRSYV